MSKKNGAYDKFWIDKDDFERVCHKRQNTYESIAKKCECSGSTFSVAHSRGYVTRKLMEALESKCGIPYEEYAAHEKAEQQMSFDFNGFQSDTEKLLVAKIDFLSRVIVEYGKEIDRIKEKIDRLEGKNENLEKQKTSPGEIIESFARAAQKRELVPTISFMHKGEIINV